MTRLRRCVLLVLALTAMPATGLAQGGRQADARHAAALTLFGGAASGESGTGPALGWAIGWMPSTRVTVEGGTWWTREPSIEGFAALLGTRVSVTPPAATATAFVSGEIGLYRATVDSTDRDVPPFYLERMTEGPLSRTFDDFSFAVGGGVEFPLKRHLSLRPHARVMFVTADGRVRPMAIYGVHLSYNFLEHPVTP
jgi:hypothetical protein